MKIGELKDYIINQYFSKHRVERKYGLLFLGPPGVGKSYNVELAGKEIAKKLGKKFLKVVVRWSPAHKKFMLDSTDIETVLNDADKYFVFTDYRLSTIEPSDLSGPLRSREGIAFYDPLLWAVLHSATEGILFLDEITWIQRDDVFSIVPQLVLDKISGLTAFHPKTLVVSAGNRPEDASSMVRLLHNPLLNRFKVININPPTVEEWAEWMNTVYGNNWDIRTFAFLSRFKSEGYLLKVPQTGEGLENFPTPRTWTWVALDLKEGFDSVEDIVGLLGGEVGQKFVGFLKLNIDIEELIQNPSKFISLSIDAKYMASMMLSSWYQDKQDIKKILPLIDVMFNEKHEYIILTCVSMKGKGDILLKFIKDIISNRPDYKQTLFNIAVDIKRQIQK